MTVELSTYASFIAPATADDVPAFIAAAAFAVGKSESELAKFMGVSRAAVSNWKVRKTLPDQHLKWFQSPEFVEAVLIVNSAGTIITQHAGIPIVLRLCRQTGFAPFGKGGEPQMRAITRYFGGLCALALFVQWHTHVSEGADADMTIAERVERGGEAWMALATDRLQALLERMGHLA